MKCGKKCGFLVFLLIPLVILIYNSKQWTSFKVVGDLWFDVNSKKSKNSLNVNHDERILGLLNTSTTRIDSPYDVTTQQPVPEEPKRPMVVVLAYMHTGSTFLGSILQNHRGAFYEYENLRALMYSTHAGKVIRFLNGTTSKLTPNPDPNNIHHNVDPRIGAEAVRNMLTCNNDQLDVATLANHYFSLTTAPNLHVKEYFKCQEKLFGSPLNLRAVNAIKYVQNRMLLTNRTDGILRKCLPILLERCRNSSLVAEKFIRMTMEMAEILLTEVPDVKIIHLVRDPRAMLDSQVRKGDSSAQSPSVFPKRTKYMCEQMSADIKLATTLKEKHPDRIYTVRYEDLVKQGVSAIDNIFKFINVPFTDADKTFISKKSRKDPAPVIAKTSETELGIQNSNFKTRTLKSVKNTSVKKPINIAKRAPLRRPQTKPIRRTPPKEVSWREHISKTNFDTLNKFCSDVYEMLGYVKFTNYLDLRNKKLDHYIPMQLN